MRTRALFEFEAWAPCSWFAGYHLVYTDTIPQEFNFDDPKVLDNNRAYFASSFVG